MKRLSILFGMIDTGNCTGECCKDMPPFLTPSTAAVSVSPSVTPATNTGPTLRVPVFAIPLIALGPVLISFVILYLSYLVWKRRISHKPSLTLSLREPSVPENSLLASSHTTLSGDHVGSYRNPVDAVVLVERPIHIYTDSSSATTPTHVSVCITNTLLCSLLTTTDYVSVF